MCSRKVALKLARQCDLMYGFLTCALPEDMIDMDLKVYMMKGIHTFKKDYKSKNSKHSPWRAEVQPYPTLRKRMVEFMCSREKTTTPYPNKTYHPKTNHPKPKTSLKKRKLVQLTKPDRSKLAKPRNINMQKFPISTSQLNWKSTTV